MSRNKFISIDYGRFRDYNDKLLARRSLIVLLPTSPSYSTPSGSLFNPKDELSLTVSSKTLKIFINSNIMPIKMAKNPSFHCLSLNLLLNSFPGVLLSKMFLDLLILPKRSLPDLLSVLPSFIAVTFVYLLLDFLIIF